MSKDNGDKSSDLNDDFELLKRVWLIERFSPEILNFHEDLLSKFFSIIKSKEKSNNNPKTKTTKHCNMLKTLDLRQMEIDRIKYMINCYLRTRLSKIKKFAFYIKKSKTQFDSLSTAEQCFLNNYCGLLKTHLKNSFTNHLNNEWGNVDSVLSDIDSKYVARPKLDSFVFIRAIKDLGPVKIAEENSQDVDILDEERLISENDVLLGKYKYFKKLIEEGSVELI